MAGVKVVISRENRKRLIRLVGYAYIADKLLNSRWLKEMLGDAYDAGFHSAEYQHDGFKGVSGWVNDNPWRK